MDTMPMPKCPQCGEVLPPNAPAGLCPQCLMALNLEDETFQSGDAPQATPEYPILPPEQIAPLFPQLEILECLGRGGMGVVYKARQKSLGRFVALKLLAPERADDPQFAVRFEKEARALAALNHPNIVAIYDFGVVRDTPGASVFAEATADRSHATAPFYFFIMEFVGGGTLWQLMSRERVPARQALAIVPQICDALQFAHDQGIVHRDIKPENILLDRQGRVKVADFGLAKSVAAEGGASVSASRLVSSPAPPAENSPALTDPGKVMGTPQYMSPEQINAPGEVDHRTDIYALGVVLYQLLTGELPGQKVEPPSSRMRGMQLDVRVDEIVLRALEQQPALRYQQASEFKARIETFTGTTESGGRREDAPTIQEKQRMQRRVAAARWTARILGTLCVLPLLFAQGFPLLAKPPGAADLALSSLGAILLLLGLVIGWWHEGTAALLLAAGWTGFRIAVSEWPVITPLELVLAVAALYAFCWWATRGRQTTLAIAAILVFAGLLALGRGYSPANVSVAGVVVDALMGKPVAGAELRLLPRSPRWLEAGRQPNARADGKGQFQLHVGWFKEQTEVAVSAKGYSVLTTNLGPRLPGHRAVTRDYVLQPTPAVVPPVVVETNPESGATNVPPDLTEIRVIFSKEMARSWTCAHAWTNSLPTILGEPNYEADRRTCVLRVKLEPNQVYGCWLNSPNPKLRHFRDTIGREAVPYLLIFRTGDAVRAP
jgi:hypothetical protein